MSLRFDNYIARLNVNDAQFSRVAGDGQQRLVVIERQLIDLVGSVAIGAHGLPQHHVRHAQVKLEQRIGRCHKQLSSGVGAKQHVIDAVVAANRFDGTTRRRR